MKKFSLSLLIFSLILFSQTGLAASKLGGACQVKDGTGNTNWTRTSSGTFYNNAPAGSNATVSVMCSFRIADVGDSNVTSASLNVSDNNPDEDIVCKRWFYDGVSVWPYDYGNNSEATGNLVRSSGAAPLNGYQTLRFAEVDRFYSVITLECSLPSQTILRGAGVSAN